MESIKRIFLIVIALILLPSIAFSTTINASSCDYYDVLVAYNSASDGDTINIPSGTTTWPSTFTMSGKNVSLIQHASGTTITGPSGSYTIDITATDTPFEISLNIDGNRAGRGFYIDSSPKNFRIYNCHFKHVKTYTIWLMGASWGVIDNCIFESCQSGLRSDGSTIVCTATGGLGVATDTVYVEDCIFDYDVTDYTSGFSGSGHHFVMTGCARTVFRYNDVNVEYGTYLSQVDHWDAHGYCFAARYNTRGAYAYEIYENTFTFAKAYRGLHLRGGKGVVYNNTFIVSAWSASPWVMYLNNYRSWTDCGLGLCTATEGYPCQDQINNLYIWNNTLGGTALASGTNIVVHSGGDTPTHIQLGMDFFEHSAVTAIGYAPYTYPHPLTGASGVTLYGSATGGINESDVVTGGKEIWWHLTDGDTLHSTLGDNNSRTTDQIAALVSNRNEANGWNNIMLALLNHTHFTRIDSQTYKCTLPAGVGYNPEQTEEKIDCELLGTSTTSGVTQTPTPTDFSIGVEQAAGSAVGEGVSMVWSAQGRECVHNKNGVELVIP